MRTHITAIYRRRVVRVPLADITHFVSGDKYVTAHHPGGELVISETLKSLEAELAADFIRTHRTTLARRALACEYTQPDRDAGQIRLHGVDAPLPVSRSRVGAVKSLLAEA